MIDFEQWEGFEGRIWKEEVNVRDFIQKNYTPYDGDESFLAGPTEATDKLWGALQKLQKAERAKGGVLDMETEVVSGLTAYGPGYIDESLKEFEQIVGLQTDKPLKRAFMPYGGIKMAEQACTTYGYQPSEELHKIFTDYTRTHNQAVFDAYTPEMKTARHTHIITGLPDTYGRGRIVGDYRRVALYGIDALIKFKQEDFANCGDGTMTDDVIRLREEIARQINALKGMKKMAEAYGCDISQPAKTAKEACQWLYFGYLAAIKTQNGAAMSVGRISTFLDIYIQRDLDKGILTESEAQELIDHMVMKFRMVKFARIPSYNQLTCKYRCQTAAGLAYGVRQTPHAVRLHGGAEQQRIALSGVLPGVSGEHGLLQRGAPGLGLRQLPLQTFHSRPGVYGLDAEALPDVPGLRPCAGEIVQRPFAAQQLNANALSEFLYGQELHNSHLSAPQHVGAAAGAAVRAGKCHNADVPLQRLLAAVINGLQLRAPVELNVDGMILINVLVGRRLNFQQRLP